MAFSFQGGGAIGIEELGGDEPGFEGEGGAGMHVVIASFVDCKVYLILPCMLLVVKTNVGPKN